MQQLAETGGCEHADAGKDVSVGEELPLTRTCHDAEESNVRYTVRRLVRRSPQSPGRLAGCHGEVDGDSWLWRREGAPVLPAVRCVACYGGWMLAWLSARSGIFGESAMGMPRFMSPYLLKDELRDEDAMMATVEEGWWACRKFPVGGVNQCIVKVVVEVTLL